MKIKRLKPGFTLIELLVAMSITVILLGVLVYITGISMDTYKRSRNEVRASRQAKEALEIISKDFESMISRRDGNNYEWLYAKVETIDGDDQTATGVGLANKSQLIFFTGATDRYDGNIGNDDPAKGTVDDGGDVSAVGYRLAYKDQISDNSDDKFKVFSLYRRLVDPKDAFDKLLAVGDLTAVGEFTEANDLVASNFLVENIYEFTVTFLVEYSIISSGANPTTTTKIERVTLSPGSYDEFRLLGNKIQASGSKATEIENGNLIGVEVSISVITDHGLTVAKHMNPALWKENAAKYTYHFTKTINTPRP